MVITGTSGLLGWHALCWLRLAHGAVVDAVPRDAWGDPTGALARLVDGSDGVVHCAAVNRGDPSEVIDGNREITERLILALSTVQAPPPVVVLTNSIRCGEESPYGHAKQEVRDALARAGDELGFELIDIEFPHVFGEGGRPFHNSVVATFCARLAGGQPLEIDELGHVELVHVCRASRAIADALIGRRKSGRLEGGHAMSVAELADRLRRLHRTYVRERVIPDVGDGLTRHLFNTLRWHLPWGPFEGWPKRAGDERGWFMESVRAESGGQFSISQTEPWKLRGEHAHFHKFERFIVIKGRARVRFRRLAGADVVGWTLDDSGPRIIDIPTLTAHDLWNPGPSELIMGFWTDEFFDPEHPDTYPASVVGEYV